MRFRRFGYVLAAFTLSLNINLWAQGTTPAETYDANGNTLTTGGNSYTYDSQNHLIGMNNGAVTLTYDGGGNLISKTVNGVTTQYLVDDLNATGLPQAIEETVDGVVQRRYTVERQRISQTLYVNNATITSYYGYDGQGNVRQLTDSAGAVTDTYDYDAFGNLIGHTGTTPNHFLYRGERYDTDLNLYYLRARWYNPVTGRFMSRDPEEGKPDDPQSLHKYLYAGGDPINKEDPTGEATIPFPAPAPFPMPAPNGIRVGGGLVDYGLIIGVVALGTIAADKEVACALNTAYDRLALTVAAGQPAIPEPEKCKAKCAPCDPPAGTTCQQSDSGHLHHGWDPHYHLWKRGQRPDCTCTWNKINDKTRPDPIYGKAGDLLPECSSFPSWSLTGGR